VSRKIHGRKVQSSEKEQQNNWYHEGKFDSHGAASFGGA